MTARSAARLQAMERRPVTNWAREEEPERFAKMVKLYRQGKVSEDDFRKFRLQNGTYSSRFQSDFSMLRIKIPTGEVTPQQMRKVADLCQIFSIGSAHVSTRQNFQLHWLQLDDIPEILRELLKVGLTSREACGNGVRNVIDSPLSGICPFEHFDVTPYAKGVTKYFLRNPLNQNLPRKFKINFSCCDQHGLARIGDIGLVPKVVKEDGRARRGFQIFLGGGLGAGSFVAELLEEFTPEEDLIASCVAVVRFYDRSGDREKMHRNRMRYLVHDLGFEKFRALILDERKVVKATMSARVKLELIEQTSSFAQDSDYTGNAIMKGDDQYQRWFFSNVLPQKQKGFSSVTVTFPAGDVSADQLVGLAEICENYSHEGVIRLTPNQNVVLRWVEEDEVSEVYGKLVGIGLGNRGANSMASTVGCSGTTSCNLAITNSHRLAKEIQSKILDMDLDLDHGLKTSSIKISGCPNSCGQHEIATLGFYGGASRVEGAQTPTYQMLIGGKASGSTAVLGTTLMRVPAKKVLDVVIKTIELYKNSRGEKENMVDWMDRVVRGDGPGGLKSSMELKSHLEPLTVIPPVELAPEAYVDWGNDEKFRAKTAKGECAA